MMMMMGSVSSSLEVPGLLASFYILVFLDFARWLVVLDFNQFLNYTTEKSIALDFQDKLEAVKVASLDRTFWEIAQLYFLVFSHSTLQPLPYPNTHKTNNAVIALLFGHLVT